MTGGNARATDAAAAANSSERPLSIEVLRGDPTPEELAALIAVVSEAYAREAADAVADDRGSRSAWDRRRRGLRQPLTRGSSAWSDWAS
ncbi:acyl-CoA carboxylase subunit epsilon [Microbacterium sp. P02]|uniref:acyl-CoA carboxylase subunit epsilon n=1 Tax=Microbacterium sp. P02 TaxID=3366260 RepID=UPI00366BBD3B